LLRREDGVIGGGGCLRVLVVGSGAVGGLLAVRLARAGYDPRVVVRAGKAPSGEYGWLTLRLPDGSSERAFLRFTDRPESSAPADIAFLATKAMDMPAAVDACVRGTAPAATVVTLSNGLPPWAAEPGTPADDGDIAGTLADRRIIAGSVYHAVRRLDDGNIEVAALRRLVIGAPDPADRPRLASVQAILAAAGLKPHQTDDPRAEVWGKLCANVVTGPLCIVHDRPVSEMLRIPGAQQHAVALCADVAAVANAVGLRVPPPEAVVAVLHEVGAFQPSMYQDFRAGRPLEIEATLNAPLDLATRHGVDVPTLAALRDRLCALDAANRTRTAPVKVFEANDTGAPPAAW
jgi:2-dehydropantoate 2-reductase